MTSCLLKQQLRLQCAALGLRCYGEVVHKRRRSDTSRGWDCLAQEPPLLIVPLLRPPQLRLLLPMSLRPLMALHPCVCRCRLGLLRLGLLRPGAQVVHHSLAESNSTGGINVTERGARPKPSHGGFFICLGENDAESAVAG
ncbi:hypothetical protein EYF80_024761 [Liparis tanakae]|uniref:Uncharacterized protein n=1 Tax=Liparis tanakae TaxID=230148 RepID=A0A4Z2HJH9_9TELE|nr:hypothetical protein EYF80_024761 [Liparis tanakae]